MKNQSTLVAALLLVGLGSWYYFYEFKGKDARDKAKEDTQVIFKDFDATAVQEVLLHQASGDVALKKVAGAWTITHPVQAIVDSTAMDTLLDSLKTMKKGDVVDDKGTNLGGFGLLSPSASATFATGPNTAKTIFFGMDNPTGQFSYAQVQGQAQIFMVTRMSKTNVVKEAKDLRDKKVLDFQPSQVASLKSNFGTGVAIEMDKQGRWNVTSPIKDLGNHDTILSWLQQLATLRIDTFVDETGKNLSKYGLAVPTKKIEISLNGQSKPLVLYMGKKLEGKKGSYYRVEGKPLVFSMPDYISNTLEKKAEDLVDKQAFGLKSYEVQSFDVVRGGKTLHAEKKDNVWAWDPAPPKKAGDPEFDFLTFLGDVSSAQLKARLPKDTKIPNPTMVITFRGDKDAALERITVGAKGKQGLVVLSMSKEQAVEVAEDLFSKLPQ